MATRRLDSVGGRPASSISSRECAALDELGDDVDRAVGGAADVVDRDDVGMVERRGRAGLDKIDLGVAWVRNRSGFGSLIAT